MSVYYPVCYHGCVFDCVDKMIVGGFCFGFAGDGLFALESDDGVWLGRGIVVVERVDGFSEGVWFISVVSYVFKFGFP